MTGDIALMMNMNTLGCGKLVYLVMEHFLVWVLDRSRGIVWIGFWESWIFPLILAMLDDMDRFVYTMDISSEV